MGGDGELHPVAPCLSAWKVAASAYNAWPTYPDSFKQIYDPGHDALYPPLFCLLLTIAAVIGAQTMLGELANGLIRTTFIAVPNRSRVLLAKVGVVTAVLTVVGVVTAVLSWAAVLAGYSDRITAFSWSTPGTGRFVLATVVAFPVSGLIGMAIASLVRNTAATMFALFIYFVGTALAPIASLDTVFHTDQLFTFVSNSLPFWGWIFLTTMGSGKIVGAHPSAAHAWISFGAWAVGSVALVVAAFRHRDV
jgi:ABC-type transport system involved in multi-copper enzyme maturation permease subunit